ncbi:hypothetical protein SUGI_0576760 [Cryptomeria japonica]|uniref:glutamate receptor 2.9 isoform X2 n=1 Tax=Cryptomeria japonica TaxID=3369 RepID=UPI002408AED4|nr:glutamate receptor 2.9 isoform X2 [Cryptomeria japonica]GLJ29237.1 hypothetical protein SUGI_0576760 [Cryptomeria japonica]
MKTLLIFPVICVLVASSVQVAVQEETVNVGIILDSTPWSGKIARTAIKLGVDDVNNQSQLLNGAQMFVHLREAQTPVQSASAAVDLLANEVVALIQTQRYEAGPFISDLGEAVNVPILSLSDSSPALSNQRFPYFVRMAHSDRNQMKAIAALVKHYGWRSVAFLHSNDDFGSGGMSSLRDALLDLDSEIVYTSMIPLTAQEQTIREELRKLKTIQSSVFIVHAPCDLSMNLFMEAQEMGMMETGYVWIATQEFTSLWDYVLNASTMSSLEGLLGVKPHIPNSKKLNDFTDRWEQQFRLDNPNIKHTELNAYGLMAYDTILMIARAIGKIARNSSLSFMTPSTPLAVVANAKIKVFQEGRKLLREIFSTNFAGLSGPVKFYDGEMHGCSYEIVNIVGKSYQMVGYWPYNSSVLFKTPSFGNKRLRSVIWPGGFSTVPRGWVIPTRLKIAVPTMSGWEQFVNVSFNPDTNETTVNGLSIDVFHAIVRRLDYQLLYDFIPFPEHRNYSENNLYLYDELVRQVHLKKYDAVVGDITIQGSRNEIVDFTQPYTETGLAMVVPTTIRDEAHNSWTFLLPFTPRLWATTAAFILYTGLVVWLLERKINPEFRGSSSNQVVTLLWFAFSAMFYAHRESIHNSLSRLLVAAWLFVAMVLTSSYTANLTSRLTTQQITPLINNFGDHKVGYHSSYVGSFLTNHFGVAQKQLALTSSEKAYEEALSNGAKNGGVDAILDELPYVRAFLSGRCGYSMVGRTYHRGGFGFVFPKGSLLVQDFSKGILDLIDSGEIQEIEDKYFKDPINMCSDSAGYYTRLDVENFRGLYLIIGIVSSVVVIIFFSQALHNFVKDPSFSKQKHSIWKCTKSFVRYIYYEQVSHQTYKVEMPTKNDNLSNANNSLDDQKVAIPTSSFVNVETIDDDDK